MCCKEVIDCCFVNLIEEFTTTRSILLKIKDKLKSRQFELVGILERAEQLTGEGGKVKKVPGGEGQGACTITWTDVVNRMVSLFKFIFLKRWYAMDKSID